MSLSSLVKLAVLIAIAFFVWKWWSGQHAQTATAPQTTSAATNCVFAARSASDFWGSNIRAFASPPYDTQAWDEFKSHVDDRISTATSKCSCADDACKRATEAMDELHALVNEMDASVRSSSPPPSDAVQRQERIDNALDAAQPSS